VLFDVLPLSFNFGGEIYAATPSTNLTTSLGGRVSLGLLLKECVRKFCDSCRKQLAAESERQSLPQGHSDTASFPESDVVSPTDDMFGHLQPH